MMVRPTDYVFIAIVAIVFVPCLTAELENSSLKETLKMAKQIEIVDYDFVKNLPNRPEILLIDVREPEELQELGQIPTSINIPLGKVQTELAPDVTPEEFKQKYARDKPSLASPIVFYCRSGRRSQHASELAVALGYTNVKNYKGSWNDWAKHEGLPH